MPSLLLLSCLRSDGRAYSVQGTSDPEKVFDRAQNLENTQIINYRVEPNEKWCVLVGIAPGAPERYGLWAANWGLQILLFPDFTSE